MKVSCHTNCFLALTSKHALHIKIDCTLSHPINSDLQLTEKRTFFKSSLKFNNSALIV